ncbi:MAG TPA: glycosyltransferase family 1 protein [Solirubrobacteraceae bacterium]|nr:glycosyltransferase family 1 protein [Solirubrobacteraceae bacterium]
MRDKSTNPVLLNCRVAARPTITGVERWTREVARRLRAIDPARYLIAAPPARARLHSGPAAHAWEQLALPAIAARHRAAVVFSAANLAPLAWPRNVIVVHDAAVLRMPGAYSRAYRAWHRRLGTEAARRATAVVTVSEFSRHELEELGGIDPGRLTVIAGGVEPRFSRGAGAVPGRGIKDTEAAHAAAHLDLRAPYVLTIATDDRRKNLDALVPCAAALNRRGIELVWAGDCRPQFARTRPLTGLRALGYVPDELLVGLYRGARAFVLPSLYEGFGLTCLEAMACGTPVVAADRAALPEVCGDAALLVDPDDPTAIADAVLSVCDDPAVAARYVSAGERRARSFTWERTAAACDALLRSL